MNIPKIDFKNINLTKNQMIVIGLVLLILISIVPVKRAVNVTFEKQGIEREMALVKIVSTGEKRVESMRLSDVFRAKVIDTTHDSFVFELNGSPRKIDAFIDLMKPLGLSEVSRTGVVAIARGTEKM